jgi:hypothetical protein
MLGDDALLLEDAGESAVILALALHSPPACKHRVGGAAAFLVAGISRCAVGGSGGSQA